jgi:hypothetical protein
MAQQVYVVFYTTRSTTGTPEQQWAPNVFLTDHWEIEESKADAESKYNDLQNSCLDIHLAGIAPIDPEFSTDWFDPEGSASITRRELSC